jgi:transposase
LSGGNAHDAPEGRALLDNWTSPPHGASMIMDRAYEGDETRQLVLDLGMVPVVPPKANRLIKWDYDRTIYKRRNEVERLFRRLKGYRRIFSRFEKLDVMYRAFLNFALIVDMLKC